MRKRLIIYVLLISLIFSFAGAATYAWFTSSAQSSSNTFQAGTLKLGGFTNSGIYEEGKFASINLDNMQPGEERAEIKTLKNMGNLPLKLYRLTISDLDISGLENADAENALLESFEVMVEMIHNGIRERVYEGDLLFLSGVYGGFFDSIYNISPEDTVDMEVKVKMKEETGNIVQGGSLSFSINVFATQNNRPDRGEIFGEEVYIGAAEDAYANKLYEVYGVSKSQDNGDLVEFRIDLSGNYNPAVYEIGIRHESASIAKKIRINGVRLDLTGFSYPQDLHIDLTPNGPVIQIKRSAFPSEWKGFDIEVKADNNIVGSYWSLSRQN